MNSFTFYENYHATLCKIEDEKLFRETYMALMEYMFHDVEPTGVASAIIQGMRISLDKSKQASERKQMKSNSKQTKSERKQTEQDAKQTKTKDKKIKILKDKNIKEKNIKEKSVTVVSMIEERKFSTTIEDAVKDWVKYKIEKREGYKPTGLKSLLTQIENKVGELGEDTVVALITLSMSQNWKGIIWEKAKEVKDANVQRTAKGWGVNHDPIADFIGGS